MPGWQQSARPQMPTPPTIFVSSRTPIWGDFVTTDDGYKGEVHSVNVLRQLVKVIIVKDDEREIQEYKVERLRFRRKHNKNNKVEVNDEELRPRHIRTFLLDFQRGKMRRLRFRFH